MSAFKTKKRKVEGVQQPLAISLYYRVRCATTTCNAQVDGSDNVSLSSFVLSSMMKGWTFSEQGYFFCPKHQSHSLFDES